MCRKGRCEVRTGRQGLAPPAVCEGGCRTEQGSNGWAEPERVAAELHVPGAAHKQVPEPAVWARA